jgi:hypothetical protein
MNAHRMRTADVNQGSSCMKHRLIAAAAAASAVAMLTAAAPSGQFCYDLDVQVNGDEIVNEADCLDAPDLPGLPPEEPGGLF